MNNEEIKTLTEKETNVRLAKVQDQMLGRTDREGRSRADLEEEVRNLKHNLWMTAKASFRGRVAGQIV